MKKPIFVSYSRRDKDKVIPFVKELEKAVGADRIWIDWTGIESGDEFEDRIISAIDSSDIVLFMLSDNSLSSEYARKEVHYAYNNKKRVVPVVLDGKALRGWFQFKFGNINYTDISNPDQVNQLKGNLKEWTSAAIKQKYIELATEYLRNNPKERRHCVTYARSEDDAMFYRYIHLTQEEIECIEYLEESLEMTIRDVFFESDFNPVASDFDDLDPKYHDAFDSLVGKLATDDEFFPDEIDLKESSVLYRFRRAFFRDGFDKEPYIYSFHVILKDEDYLKILASKLEDRNLSLHELRKKMPDVYETITFQAENSYDMWYNPTAPYAVEMTEIEEDAFKAVGEKGAYADLYLEGFEDSGRFCHVNAEIEERVLSIRLEDVDSRLDGDREHLDNVDAIKVEMAMGVENYDGVIARLKKDFSGRAGLQAFRRWLDENGIEYKYSESHSG